MITLTLLALTLLVFFRIVLFFLRDVFRQTATGSGTQLPAAAVPNRSGETRTARPSPGDGQWTTLDDIQLTRFLQDPDNAV